MTILERRVGEVRPTQLIHSYGIGSIIDLPHLSVMLLGLEDWPEGYSASIVEDRPAYANLWACSGSGSLPMV